MRKPLEVIPLIVGSLATNCYIVFDTSSLEAVIIDPGDDADYIQRIISDRKLHPRKIIATHGHFDHILGVTELQLAYNIPFSLHTRDVFLVRNMRSSAKHFLGIEVDTPPYIDSELKNEEKIGKATLCVIETPGHTPGSVCLYQKETKILFTGDLLFAHGVVGRTDFSYSNQKTLDESLSKIFKLPEKTIIYPGHGEISSLGEEKPYQVEKKEKS